MKGNYRDALGEAFVRMGGEFEDLVVVTADVSKSTRSIKFKEKFPDRFFSVGIAEQNLVGIAAGLAAAGKIVFAVSPASFLTARALEQIKNDV